MSLQGVDSGKGLTPFIGFTIWVEVEDQTALEATKPTQDNNQSLGGFQAYDAQTKLHDFCVPAVNNATAHPKTEIQVGSSKIPLLNYLAFSFYKNNLNICYAEYALSQFIRTLIVVESHLSHSHFVSLVREAPKSAFSSVNLNSG